jgi:hypothetical protein
MKVRKATEGWMSNLSKRASTIELKVRVAGRGQKEVSKVKPEAEGH